MQGSNTVVARLYGYKVMGMIVWMVVLMFIAVVGGGSALTYIMRQSRSIRFSFFCGGFSKMSIAIESNEAECKELAYW